MHIITPQHPDFYPSLSMIPYLWRNQVKDKADPGNLIIDAYGYLRHLSEIETKDYLLGGELEESYENSELYWLYGADDEEEC